MFKRIAVSIIAAIIIPFISWVSDGRKNILKNPEFITDGQGHNYTVLSDLDEIMLIKSDGNKKILGKWKANRTDGDFYTGIDAMNVFGGELYCVLSKINFKTFVIEERRWVRINFRDGSEEEICSKEYGNIQNAYCTTLSEVKGKKVTVSCLSDGILVTNVSDKTETLLQPKSTAVINYAAVLPDGRILYSDILNRIYIMDEKNEPKQIYNASEAGDFYDLSIDNSGFCSVRNPKTEERYISTDNIYEDEIFFVLLDTAEVKGDIEEYPAHFGGDFIVYCVMGAMVGVGVFVLMSLKRVPVLLKIAVIIVFCLGVGGTIMFRLIDKIHIENLHLNQSLENAYMSAKFIGAEIDTDKFEKIDWNAPQESEYFSELEKLMEFDGTSEEIEDADSKNRKKITLGDKNYCWIYPIVNGEIRSGICDQFPVNLPGEILIYENFIDDYIQIAKGNVSSVACGSKDKNFEWVITVSPLKNSDGEIIALFETGISKLNYTTTSTRLSSDIFMIVALFEILTGAFILTATGIALKPLKRMRQAVDEAGKGNYGIEVKVKGRDEIASIAKAFNEMSQQIYIHTHKLSKINEAYLRFLPSGIISTIGKESVLSVERGDYNSISGYILHIRLINFTEQTEILTNDETFALINNISREIMENILGKGGVIESYNQEEYICIFNEADYAYNAAVDLIKRMRELYPKLKTTFVIVKDSMLLGIVGHEKRLGTIMLSSGIRLSTKLGKIASLCGANLIVTHDVSFFAPCPQRLLGKINFDEHEYTFFDCFEGDEISVYLSKLDGCAQFEEMVGQFYQNNWTKCRRLALKYLEKNKNDTAAIRYLFLCEDNIKHSEEKSGLENLIV